MNSRFERDLLDEPRPLLLFERDLLDERLDPPFERLERALPEPDELPRDDLDWAITASSPDGFLSLAPPYPELDRAYPLSG